MPDGVHCAFQIWNGWANTSIEAQRGELQNTKVQVIKGNVYVPKCFLEILTVIPDGYIPITDKIPEGYEQPGEHYHPCDGTTVFVKGGLLFVLETDIDKFGLPISKQLSVSKGSAAFKTLMYQTPNCDGIPGNKIFLPSSVRKPPPGSNRYPTQQAAHTEFYQSFFGSDTVRSGTEYESALHFSRTHSSVNAGPYIAAHLQITLLPTKAPTGISVEVLASIQPEVVGIQGIPNSTGSSCFMDSILQALVHTPGVMNFLKDKSNLDFPDRYPPNSGVAINLAANRAKGERLVDLLVEFHKKYTEGSLHTAVAFRARRPYMSWLRAEFHQLGIVDQASGLHEDSQSFKTRLFSFYDTGKSPWATSVQTTKIVNLDKMKASAEEKGIPLMQENPSLVINQKNGTGKRVISAEEQVSASLPIRARDEKGAIDLSSLWASSYEKFGKHGDDEDLVIHVQVEESQGTQKYITFRAPLLQTGTQLTLSAPSRLEKRGLGQLIFLEPKRFTNALKKDNAPFKMKSLNDCPLGRLGPKIDIVAFSVHRGCLRGGHYISFVKNLDKTSPGYGYWYECDDSNVSVVSDEYAIARFNGSVAGAEAYGSAYDIFGLEVGGPIVLDLDDHKSVSGHDEKRHTNQKT